MSILSSVCLVPWWAGALVAGGLFFYLTLPSFSSSCRLSPTPESSVPTYMAVATHFNVLYLFKYKLIIHLIMGWQRALHWESLTVNTVYYTSDKLPNVSLYNRRWVHTYIYFCSGWYRQYFPIFPTWPWCVFGNFIDMSKLKKTNMIPKCIYRQLQLKQIEFDKSIKSIKH